MGEDEYADYISTDDLLDPNDPERTPFKRGRNFPEIDFVSPDGKRTVSVKSVNTFGADFTSGKWYVTNAKRKGSMADGIVGHAKSLVAAAPSDEVVLDVRVPPDTPDHVMRQIEDTIVDMVDDDSGRLTVVVNRYP